MQGLRAALSILLYLSLLWSGGCRGNGSTEVGSWLGPDSIILIDISSRGRVTFFFSAGGGSCVFLARGMVDDEAMALTSDFGDVFPFTVDGDVLSLEDSMGDLGGDYRRVDFDELCTIQVPDVQQVSERVETLTPTPPESNGDARIVTVSLSLPADAVSFAFYAFGEPMGVRTAFGGLFDPQGRNVLRDERDLQFCLPGSCSLVVPKETDVLPSPGTWSAVLIAEEDEDLQVDLRGVVRNGPLPARSTIRIRPVITTDVVADAPVDTMAIEDALAGVATLFSNEGLDVTVAAPVTTDDPAFELLVQDFFHPDTAEVMQLGMPDTINVFMARRLLGQGGVLGLASGIPSAHGVTGPFNGLLVHLENHALANGTLSAALLEETIAHEIGHMMGLYHTSERTGMLHDILDDTPECDAATFDTDMDGEVFADECAGAGGENLMFWTPSTSTGDQLNQTDVSTEQLFVLERSLAAE